MKNSTFKVLVMPAVILFAVCLVSTFLLAYTNKITEPKIKELAAANAQAVRLEVLPGAKNFEKKSCELGGVSYEYFKGLSSSGKTAGYVFTTTATGYSGDVEVMTGVTLKGTVKKISILEISETPGLGMNAKKDSFLSQYTGKSGSISVVKNKNAGNSEIQAMTGATITSKAVTNAVNKALQLYKLAAAVPETVKPGGQNTDYSEGKLVLPAAKTFGEILTAQSGSETCQYRTGFDKNGKIIGYVFLTYATADEYGGTVSLATGIDASGIITGVKILDLAETSGHDSELKNSSYLKQFTGKSGTLNSNSGISAITGATVSSNAVIKAVNTALDLFKSVSGGNQ